MLVLGENVRLIPIDEGDTENIIRWRNSVRYNFIDRALFTVEGHTKWLNSIVSQGKAVQFIIETKQDGKIGSVFLRDINTVHKKAEYGIFIGEEKARGKGYGSEAAKLIIEYGFNQLNLHKIMLRVFAFNKPAIHSYEKAGFVQEGYLKDEVFVDGAFQDIILIGIVRGENNE